MLSVRGLRVHTRGPTAHYHHRQAGLHASASASAPHILGAFCLPLDIRRVNKRWKQHSHFHHFTSQPTPPLPIHLYPPSRRWPGGGRLVLGEVVASRHPHRQTDVQTDGVAGRRLPGGTCLEPSQGWVLIQSYSRGSHPDQWGWGCAACTLRVWGKGWRLVGGGVCAGPRPWGQLGPVFTPGGAVLPCSPQLHDPRVPGSLCLQGRGAGGAGKVGCLYPRLVKR